MKPRKRISDADLNDMTITMHPDGRDLRRVVEECQRQRELLRRIAAMVDNARWARGSWEKLAGILLDVGAKLAKEGGEQ